ncbi:MAG: pectin acetylesterase-family hydrolase [Eubacteriales bacterium]|nr:pectin acetylesterase-family hydrolase [Eubacteriales bacterium]
MSHKKKKIIWIVSILAVIFVAAALFADNILNVVINKTMGKELPQLAGEPKVGEWYAIDIDEAVSSDGSKWQGYFRKGSENKVVLYFYGGGFSVNEYTAARSMDAEGGFYNPRLNTGLNVMTTAIRKWGIGNDAEDNVLKDWTFIGVPYCNGDFHSGTGDKEYTALDGSTKTIHYNGYTNYRRLVTKLFDYIDSSPDQLLVTGSSAGGFGAAILADDAIALFNNPQDVAVLVDSSLLITEDWHDIMVNEWHSTQQFSDVVTTDNITLDSLVALHNKRDNVKILFDCSVRDYNLSMAQRFFDEGAQQAMVLNIGKAEGDRFQQILKKMVSDMQEQIPGCGIYIWDEETQADGHLTVHTAAGAKIFFDSESRNPSLAQWLENAMHGNVESFGLELLDRDY